MAFADKFGLELMMFQEDGCSRISQEVVNSLLFLLGFVEIGVVVGKHHKCYMIMNRFRFVLLGLWRLGDCQGLCSGSCR